MNSVCAIGNLTRDPELRTTTSGKSVCRFTIAVNGIKRKDNNDPPRVDYIPCVCWDATAENAAKYLKKGRKVAVKGSLKSGKYEKEGKTQFTLEVELDKYDGMTYLSSGNRDGGEQATEQTAMAEPVIDDSTGFTKVETDELPF